MRVKLRRYLASRRSLCIATVRSFPHMGSRSPTGTFVACPSDHVPCLCERGRRAYERQEPSSAAYGPSTRTNLLSRLDALSAEVRKELTSQGFEDKRVQVERMLNMRFDGTDTALMILADENERDEDGNEDFMRAFRRAYKAEFGFLLEEKSVIVDDIKVRLPFRAPRSGIGTDGRCRFEGSERHSTPSVCPCLRR